MLSYPATTWGQTYVWGDDGGHANQTTRLSIYSNRVNLNRTGLILLQEPFGITPFLVLFNPTFGMSSTSLSKTFNE